MGARDYLQFRTFIAQSSRSRVLAFINASCIGMLWTPEYFDPGLLTVSENDRLFMKPPEELIADDGDFVKGVTMRVFGHDLGGETTLQAVARAKDVALMAQAPLMLQIHSGADSLADILAVLSAGDIVSGVFGKATRPAIFGENGDLRPEILGRAPARCALRRWARSHRLRHAGSRGGIARRPRARHDFQRALWRLHQRDCL